MTEPRPPQPDPRTARITALGIAARIHQGTGATPYRIVKDAITYDAWLRTGLPPEPDAYLTVPHDWSDDDLAVLQAGMPGTIVRRNLPNPGRLGEQGQHGTVDDPEPHHRWWHR